MSIPDVLMFAAGIVVGFAIMHVLTRKSRAKKYSPLPKLDTPKLEPITIEIKCDNADALAKINEITAAAQRAQVELGALSVNAVRLQNGVESVAEPLPPPAPEDVDGLLKKSL